MYNFKHFLYSLVDETDNKKTISRIFNIFIMTLILLNVLTMIFETVKSIYEPYIIYFKAFEWFVMIVFSLEYLVRIYTADLAYPCENKIKSIFKYIFSFYGIIDIVSILPFYMPFTGLDFRFVRTIRLLRFLRLFKIARYNDSLDMIKKVFKEKSGELGITCFVIILVMIVASFLMFYAENEAQPETFPNVLTCIWWSIVTLTTVGYGDVYPITTTGRIVGGLIAFLGIGLVALPTGLISAGFLEEIGKKQHKKELEKSENKEDNINEKEENKNTLTKNENFIGPKRRCPCCGCEID